MIFPSSSVANTLNVYAVSNVGGVSVVGGVGIPDVSSTIVVVTIASEYSIFS